MHRAGVRGAGVYQCLLRNLPTVAGQVQAHVRVYAAHRTLCTVYQEVWEKGCVVLGRAL